MSTRRKPVKKSKVVKVTICPPAVAKGVITSAEVNRVKRPRGQGPRKLVTKITELKKRKRRRRINRNTITKSERRTKNRRRLHNFCNWGILD